MPNFPGQKEWEHLRAVTWFSLWDVLRMWGGARHTSIPDHEKALIVSFRKECVESQKYARRPLTTPQGSSIFQNCLTRKVSPDQTSRAFEC